MAQVNDSKTKDSKAGIFAHILISLIYIAAGVSMLLLDADFISQLVYSFLILALGILFICFGVYHMIKYFFNQEYTKVSNYGFTTGVLLLIIGSLFIFQANEISTYIDTIVCLISIVLGAVMLQQSFALFHIRRPSWFIGLIFGIATIGTSIYGYLMNIHFFYGEMIPTVYLISVGGVSILSLIVMAFGLRNHKKSIERAYGNVSGNDNLSAGGVDDSIFEEEPVFTSTPEQTPVTPATPDSLFEE
ncbi:MAG: DUF308 domain-containing protein [Pseudobutyrivibrio sp.]|nr:DUF308 domain-containing protein [Pseudobutyrivibrio sp.]